MTLVLIYVLDLDFSQNSRFIEKQNCISKTQVKLSEP